MLLTFDEAARASGGTILNAGKAVAFNSVTLDSRKATPFSLFVALPGERVDGHDFVEAAFAAGAVGAIVELGKAEKLLSVARGRGAVLLVCDSSLRALQDCARAYLDKFPRLLRIGITGSNGKTTTKELAAAMIGREKHVVCNAGNLNSETGLPLSVFNVLAEHETAVFELGMNRKGEIAELARVLRPHIALITNVGSAHIGKIGSKHAILEEKMAIFSQFSGGETGFVPWAVGSEQEEESWRQGPDADSFWSACSPMVPLRDYRTAVPLTVVRNLGLDGWELDVAGGCVRFPLVGEHNLHNAQAAMAIAHEVKVGAASIRSALETAKPLFGRGEVFEFPLDGGIATVVRDCYNASLESAVAAIRLCDELPRKGRKVYVFGSMLELGDESRSSHERLGASLAASNAEIVFLFGEETQPTLEVLETARGKAVYFTEDMNELKRKLLATLLPGDLVLLKASRGRALERVLEGVNI